MMHDVIENRKDTLAMLQRLVGELVTLRSQGDSYYISMPLIYPDSSPVTIKIDPQVGTPIYRISDGGFAYREIESIGYESSFSRAAKKLAETEDLDVSGTVIYTEAEEDMLLRAIHDVANISWRCVDHVYAKAKKFDEVFEQELRDRLFKVFGADHVSKSQTIVGSSAYEWNVTGIVELAGKRAVFLAVTEHAASINKASTAFHDLSALHENPPILISVVKDKQALGPKLAILSQAGKVIDENQSDEVFMRAAA